MMRFVPAPGESFFDSIATHLLETVGTERGGDLSGWQVLVPALPMAAELRAALARAAGRPLLLPRFDTWRAWVQSCPLPGAAASLPACRRLVLLVEALRDKGWFDEAALWGIAAELGGLFDELTAAAVRLPDDVQALVAQLEAAYALRASAPLAFEARVVHELWHALAREGGIDDASAYRLKLAEAARHAARPLVVLLDAVPDEALDDAERDFLRAYGEALPVLLIHPAPRESQPTPLLTVLDAAWPGVPEQPLIERAAAMRERFAQSPLHGRLALLPCAGREAEARTAVAEVGAWLQAGRRRIALIAQDRLTARRVRALLEREQVRVSDETGWVLSTSRAAACIDALLETVAGNAYHRDLLDLCKSPFVCAAAGDAARAIAVRALEAAIRDASVKAGLARIRRALAEAETEADARAAAQALLDRVEAAQALLAARPAPLWRWLGRLAKALEALGASAALREDAAGAALLDLLETRREELAGADAAFAFNAFRDWLNRELEAASFRDGSVASPLVVTALNAVCLRRFEAALLIGGDARLLAPAAQSAFFGPSARRELGLRTREDGERELRRDLELLLATVPCVAVTWQSTREGEANLLAPEWLLLSSLHALAWGDDLHRRPLPARPERAADAGTAPVRARPAAPVAPAAMVPQRVSVSAYASLIACPYRFFARHVLRLGELDEVSEQMEKSDYGALVHRVLERFHAQHPLVSALSETEALAALQAAVDAVFAAAVGENFLANGWRLRWQKRLPAYLAWQRAREAEGWRWQQAETRVQREFALADGARVELYGRIDRIDACGERAALLDYKTQTAKAIGDRLDEDVQLPAYALIRGGAPQVAYVALDDEAVVAVARDDDPDALLADAAAQEARLLGAFAAMRAGAQLPAHGADSVCRWCEMAGLCRKGHWAAD